MISAQSLLRLALLTLLSVLLRLPTAQAAVRVVTTLPDLAALAKELGGGAVTVTSLALPTQDAHWVDARPNLALELSKADMLLVAGLDLEVGWLPNLLTGARNPDVQIGAKGYVDCSQYVQLLQVPTVAVNRSMGDVHPGGNPHYLYDPRRAKSVAAGIASRLVQLDPAQSAVYQANLTRLHKELDAAILRWEGQLVGLKGVPVVGYHNSWPYLADWLGFTIIEHIEPRPGIPPTPTHVSHVLQTMKAQGARLLIQESWFPTTTTQLVADKSGAKLVILPGGADVAAGETYLQNMDQLIGALAAGLGG
jgi:zinc/manganese transport system substrate-binding protein